MELDPHAVSRNLRRLMAQEGLTVRDVQAQLGLESPQAVYKWLTGKSLPTTRHLYALSRMLHTTMEAILIGDGQDGSAVFWRHTICIICPWNIFTSPMCFMHPLAVSIAGCS